MMDIKEELFPPERIKSLGEFTGFFVDFDNVNCSECCGYACNCPLQDSCKIGCVPEPCVSRGYCSKPPY